MVEDWERRCYAFLVQLDGAVGLHWGHSNQDSGRGLAGEAGTIARGECQCQAKAGKDCLLDFRPDCEALVDPVHDSARQEYQASVPGYEKMVC